MKQKVTNLYTERNKNNISNHRHLVMLKSLSICIVWKQTSKGSTSVHYNMVVQTSIVKVVVVCITAWW
jgi:hypothetical protein